MQGNHVYVACNSGNPCGALTTYIQMALQPCTGLVAEFVATASGLQTTNMSLLNMHIALCVTFLGSVIKPPWHNNLQQVQQVSLQLHLSHCRSATLLMTRAHQPRHPGVYATFCRSIGAADLAGMQLACMITCMVNGKPFAGRLVQVVGFGGDGALVRA